jgi:hypothetical protein
LTFSLLPCLQMPIWMSANINRFCFLSILWRVIVV